MPPRPDNAARPHRPRGPSGAARGCEALLYPENRLIFRMILTHYLLRVDGKRDTILQKAIRLCDAAFGILWTYDGERFHAVAFCNVPPRYAEFLREPHLPGPFSGLGRVARGERFAHITDMLEDDAYRSG